MPHRNQAYPMNGNSEVPTNYPLHPPPNLNQPPPPQRPQMQYYQYHSNHGYHVPHHHGYSGDTQQPPPPTLQGFNSMYSSNPYSSYHGNNQVWVPQQQVEPTNKQPPVHHHYQQPPPPPSNTSFHSNSFYTPVPQQQTRTPRVPPPAFQEHLVAKEAAVARETYQQPDPVHFISHTLSGIDLGLSKKIQVTKETPQQLLVGVTRLPPRKRIGETKILESIPILQCNR